jgi:FkbM family methyltransferase
LGRHMCAVSKAIELAHASEHPFFWVNGESCDLVFIRRSSTLLVTFDNLASINERPEERPWPAWMGPRAERLDYSILSLQSHQKDWYRTPEPAAQIEALKAQGFFEPFEHILFIGTSMGAFAALCFAGMVPGAKVLAFSPQSTLNRQIAPFERRYPFPFRKFDWESPAFLDAAEHIGEIASGHVFFDPMVVEDKRHAERLTAPQLEQIAVPFAGHTLIRVLVKSGAFDHLLAHYPKNGVVGTEFFQRLRNKRNDPKWARPFLRAAKARRSPALFRAAAGVLHKNHGNKYAAKLLGQLDRAEAARPPVDWTAPEAEIRARLPVFVNSYNQLSYLRDTVDWFAKHGFRNVTVLDNLSTLPAVLDYFESEDFAAKARLDALGENMGPRRALAHAAEDPATDAGFVFTDPDLTLPAPPAPDMLRQMYGAGKEHKFAKVGLALSIDPELVDLDRITYKNRTVGEVEKKYWKDAVEDGVYRATTDTTFFLYVPQKGGAARFNDMGLRQAKIPAIRFGRPGFVALHRPWLFSDKVDRDEMEQYFDSVEGHSTYVMAQKNVVAQGGGAPSVPLPPPQAQTDRAKPNVRTLLKFALQALCDTLSDRVTLIQVGANDGKMADPVFPYITQGQWCGVMIEPHPLYFKELSARHSERPELKMVNTAIASQAGELELFHLNEDARGRYPRGIRGCASLDRGRMEDALRRGRNRKGTTIEDGDIVATKVAVRRLDEVLGEAGLEAADLMVIDVEGHELEVFKSFDAAKLRLKMAIVECNGLNRGDEAEIVTQLKAAGLVSFRIGDDILGMRPDAVLVPLPMALELAGLSPL